MPIRLRHVSLATFVAVLVSTGCQGSGAFAQLQQNLSGIAANQDKILKQIAALEKEVGEIEIPAPTAAVAAGPGAAAKKPQKPAGPKPGRPDPSSTYKVEIGDAYVKGPADAKITIVEWSDFQCPYCKRVGPTIDALKKEYGDDLRVAFKHNPLSFHSRATPAAVAAEAAGKQGKFWEMHDKLFENNKALGDEDILGYAKEIGLDTQQFQKDLKDSGIAKKVQAQQAQGMSLGARGTPAFFVNGRFLSGAQPVANFKKLIDEEVAKADKLIASGVAKKDVYAKTIAKGKTKV